MTDSGRDFNDDTTRQPLSEEPEDQATAPDAAPASGPPHDITAAPPWLTVASEAAASGGVWLPPQAVAPAPDAAGPDAAGPDQTILMDQTAGGRPRRRGRFGATAAAAAIVIVIGVVAAVAASGTAGKATLTPRQVLVAAVHKEAKLSSVAAKVSIRAGGQAQATVSASVQVQEKPLQVSLRMSESAAGQTIPVNLIADNSAMYVKLGSSVPGIPAGLGDKWLKIPLGKLGAGSLFSSLEQNLQNANPMSQTHQLLAISHLHSAGTAQVDGVSTTKYTGSLAPSAALKELPAGQRAFFEPALKAITGKIGVSVWIDGQQRIRKLVETEQVEGNTVSLTMTITSYNQPVHITIPAKGQVIDSGAPGLGGSST